MATDQEKMEEKIKEDKAIKKTFLRDQARIYGDEVVIECAQGLDSEGARAVPEGLQRDIVANFQAFLGVEDLSETSVRELYAALQPDSLLERIAYRKAAKFAPTKEFLEIKGIVG